MIPHRVKLSGFLSYKDEQEILFGSSPLWMLSGVNGSGKSSVFDAVTYALFGHHRGGSQNAVELINKDSPALAVEFDFKLDTCLHRVKRTLKRGNKGNVTGTQQLFRLSADGAWEAVPDTNKKADFDTWVHDKVGLSYETFTSSVLLLQGKAEKLLDSKPSGRAEVLAGIVDLERYQRLHEKANARRLALKGQLDSLSAAASNVPDVSEAEDLAAENAIAAAADNRTEAQGRVSALHELEGRARSWSETQARLAAAREKLEQAGRLLGDAAKIETEFARLEELKQVIPAVSTVVTARGKLQESDRRTERLHREREDAQERKVQAEHNLDAAKKKRDSLRKTLKADEDKRAETDKRLRELSAVLQSVRLAEDQEADLARLGDELKRLPADPEAAVRAAADEADRLTELNRVLPILERFQTERHDLAAAARAEQAALAEQHRIKVDGEKAKAASDKVQREANDAKQALANAEQQLAVAQVTADRAAEAAAEFATLAGAKSCRACGQPLTARHFAEEKRKREAEAAAAAARHREAVASRGLAADRERELAGRVESLQKELADLRDGYRDQANALKQTATDIRRLTESLGLRYAEMPEPFRGRIAAAPPADWTRTAFPARDELIALRREAAGQDGAKRRLRDARDVQSKWAALTARAESVRQTLAALKAGLPAGDPARLREEHRTLQAAEQTLVGGIKAIKQAVEAVEREADLFGKEAHAAVTALTELVGKLQTEDVARRLHQETIDRATKDLPPIWQQRMEKAGLAEHHALRGELDTLTQAGVEARFKQLAQARAGLDAIRGDIGGLEQEADLFPGDARRSPDEVKAMLADARKQLDAADADWHEARKRKAVFDGYREQRAKLGERYKEADAEHNRYKLLADLLGRDRLQRHLVRQAERQIVDYANGVLDRLSGGQLFLKLVGTDNGTTADKALDLECSNRVTGGGPINVAFLSGSQRFRVAVSLALGIGQYASKQHRPIESVIIDEGFGCLDRQGRQVMIQELQNLRGHLHCILLVSHQEEFADAFPDGYRFELQDGATRVTRFQR